MEFDEYVAARGQHLVRLGLVLSSDHHRAEDLAQTALMNAYRHWRRVRAMDDPHAYVRRILVNAYLATARRSSSRETPSELDDVGQAQPDPSLALVEHDAMWRMLATLPTRERTVVILRYYEDLDYAAIATLLGIKDSSARASVSKALATLRAAHDPAEGQNR
ncbi:SigE family RNA polymerase sigma factor [Kribbella sp. NPDC051620]|uniref:SigE family RNA polymerase sigma factor n=1 Tax=Kribbella sp. NPDC051620 TaxID=3364120 RepID=UPI0037B2E6B8